MNTLIIPTRLTPMKIVWKDTVWALNGLPKKEPFIHAKDEQTPTLIFGCKKYDVCFLRWNALALYSYRTKTESFSFKYKMVLGKTEHTPSTIIINQFENLIETVFNPGLECLNKHFHLLMLNKECSDHR